MRGTFEGFIPLAAIGDFRTMVRVIRVAVSMRRSDSFDAANDCMHILQPLESFLFCPARSLQTAGAGHSAQLGR
jgi:hypothetical protein